jgi:hypothetical protein
MYTIISEEVTRVDWMTAVIENMKYVKNVTMVTQAIVGNESVKEAMILPLPHYSKTNAPIQRIGRVIKLTKSV